MCHNEFVCLSLWNVVSGHWHNGNCIQIFAEFSKWENCRCIFKKHHHKKKVQFGRAPSPLLLLALRRWIPLGRLWETRLRSVDTMGKYCKGPVHRQTKTISKTISTATTSGKNDDTGQTQRVCVDKKFAFLSSARFSPDACRMHPQPLQKGSTTTPLPREQTEPTKALDPRRTTTSSTATMTTMTTTTTNSKIEKFGHTLFGCGCILFVFVGSNKLPTGKNLCLKEKRDVIRFRCGPSQQSINYIDSRQNWPKLHLAWEELAKVEKDDGPSQNWPE